jgi:hypothetical protein
MNRMGALLAFATIVITVIAWPNRSEAARASPSCHSPVVLSPERREAIRRKFRRAKRIHHRRLIPGRHATAQRERWAPVD